MESLDIQYLHAEALDQDMRAVRRLQQQGYPADTEPQLEQEEGSEVDDGMLLGTVWVPELLAGSVLEVLGELVEPAQLAEPEQPAALEELPAPAALADLAVQKILLAEGLEALEHSKVLED